MAEANEPPRLAGQRELKEELGLDIHISQLLCIDWVPPHGPWDDLLVFVFNGGTLTDEQIATLKPLDNELAAFEFCTPQKASQRLRPYVWHRTRSALQALTTGAIQYLQNGNPIQQ